VVWSFLLLGEVLRQWQVVGIAIVLSGLLAFLVMNQRGYRTRHTRAGGAPPMATESPLATV
jgi:hypothetical protein